VRCSGKNTSRDGCVAAMKSQGVRGEHLIQGVSPIAFR
jgi:hypothetical protein